MRLWIVILEVLFLKRNDPHPRLLCSGNISHAMYLGCLCECLSFFRYKERHKHENLILNFLLFPNITLEKLQQTQEWQLAKTVFLSTRLFRQRARGVLMVLVRVFPDTIYKTYVRNRKLVYFFITSACELVVPQPR